MVQRVPDRKFSLSSMMGGMTAQNTPARRPAAKKFSLGEPAAKPSDVASFSMRDPGGTMAVLHKAFGGDVNGQNTQNAARALGLPAPPQGGGMLEEMMKTNVQFLSLQNTIQQDNRKGASLSNSSKSGHDSAMGSVRNLK